MFAYQSIKTISVLKLKIFGWTLLYCIYSLPLGASNITKIAQICLRNEQYMPFRSEMVSVCLLVY
jgi:hypothetical protein